MACMGYLHVGSGHAEGAWADALSNPHFRDPFLLAGPPVLSDVEERLGSVANITGVRWRVDGGDVRETGRSSIRNGTLASPENVEVVFREGQGVLEGELWSFLDPRRPLSERADIVESFLEAIRPGQADNRDLAERFAPHTEPQHLMPQPVASPGGPTFADPPPPVRAIGGFVVNVTLSANASTARLTYGGISHATFSAGAWSWTVQVPTSSNTTYDDEGKWYFGVSTRDRMSFDVVTRDPTNETALIRSIDQRLAAMNFTVWPSTWDAKSHGFMTGIWCDPDAVDAIIDATS